GASQRGRRSRRRSPEERRMLLGMSQERLGEAIGLTFQQIQKYERGTNRVSASRLYDLSQALQTDMNYFFDAMPEEIAASSVTSRSGAQSAAVVQPEQDPISKRETLELVRVYYRIKRPDLRRRLFEMTKAMAAIKESQQSERLD